VPPPPSVSVTPLGSGPTSVRVAAAPKWKAETMLNVPGVPTEKVAVDGLVMRTASLTVRVNCWTAGVPTPLLAVNESV